MNSDTNGTKPIVVDDNGKDTGSEDFDDMDKTAVLNDSAAFDEVSSGVDESFDAVMEKTVVLDEPTSITDNVGDVSVEINVEELIADIEANEDKDAARKKEIRRRLEEAAEERSLDDTYAIDLGEDSD
jgi:PHD/YefM family antitoxin component YafN of YafNO toxin-antitoxin module